MRPASEARETEGDRETEGERERRDEETKASANATMLRLMAHVGEIAGLATACLWAISSFLWASVGKKTSVFGVNGFKALVGCILVTIAAFLVTKRAWPLLTTAQLATLVASGVIGLALGDAYYFTALMSLGPRRALVLGLLAAPLSAVLGMVVLGEKISPCGWMGMALTLAGIALVQLETTQGGPERVHLVRGMLGGLGGAVAQAIASAMNKDVLKAGVSELHVPQVRLAAAAVAILIIALGARKCGAWFGPFREKRMAGMAFAATCLGTALGLVLMTVSQKHASIGVSNTLTSTAPLFALPIAVIVKRERLSARAWIATLIAVGGVALMFV